MSERISAEKVSIPIIPEIGEICDSISRARKLICEMTEDGFDCGGIQWDTICEIEPCEIREDGLYMSGRKIGEFEELYFVKHRKEIAGICSGYLYFRTECAEKFIRVYFATEK